MKTEVDVWPTLHNNTTKAKVHGARVCPKLFDGNGRKLKALSTKHKNMCEIITLLKRKRILF